MNKLFWQEGYLCYDHFWSNLLDFWNKLLLRELQTYVFLTILLLEDILVFMRLWQNHVIILAVLIYDPFLAQFHVTFRFLHLLKCHQHDTISRPPCKQHSLLHQGRFAAVTSNPWPKKKQFCHPNFNHIHKANSKTYQNAITIHIPEATGRCMGQAFLAAPPQHHGLSHESLYAWRR